MPRPKGSKNKASLKKGAMTVTDIDAALVKERESLAELEEQKSKALAEIEEKKATLKDVKKLISAKEKAIAKLSEQRDQAAAIEKAKEQKAEIEAVVTKLVSSGKSAEDIMAALNTI